MATLNSTYYDEIKGIRENEDFDNEQKKDRADDGSVVGEKCGVNKHLRY